MTTKTVPPREVATRPGRPGALLALEVPLGELRPAAVNDAIYKPVHDDDPAVRELAESIRVNGVLDPIVATADGVILSGHRRHAAARIAGLQTVPVVRRGDLLSTDPGFTRLLVEANRSRDKTAGERVREAVAVADPAEAHAALVRHRHAARAAGGEQAEREGLAVVAASAAARRDGVSAAERPMLDALKKIVADNRDFWPLTLRQCHYRMLIPYVARSDTSSNVWKRRVMRDAKSLACVVGTPASVASIAARKVAKCG